MTEPIKFKVLSDEEIINVCKEAWDEAKMGGAFPVESLYDNMLAIPMLQAQLKDTLRQVMLMLDGIDGRIDIPDEIFQSAEARRCGFSKRSFLEAGWMKIQTIKQSLQQAIEEERQDENAIPKPND